VAALAANPALFSVAEVVGLVPDVEGGVRRRGRAGVGAGRCGQGHHGSTKGGKPNVKMAAVLAIPVLFI
jgi:hypothetical protein